LAIEKQNRRPLTGEKVYKEINVKKLFTNLFLAWLPDQDLEWALDMPQRGP
jgi:hypothetical protein